MGEVVEVTTADQPDPADPADPADPGPGAGDDADAGGPTPVAADLSVADLPDVVRRRVLTWVADALPRLAELADLPAPLRRVRDFAPARRARAGATALTAALDDDAFRSRAAIVVTEPGGPAAGGSADGGEPSDPAAAPARAARAWLVRPDGWQQELAAALVELAEADRGAGVGADRLRRLERRADQAEAALRDVRSRHRAEVEELKAENARLRRSLGQERAGARDELERARAEVDRAEAALAEALALARSREREARQVQARLERAEDVVGAERRAARSERDDATLRTRLLLDTLSDAAAGLRRELALPSTTGSPGERVERDLASEGVRDPSEAGGLGGDSAALLAQYLAMPRARLVVDGYNVSRSVWESRPLEAQRARLLQAVAPLVARTGAETTVVFDAHQVASRPVVAAPRGVRVVFSPEGVIADDVVRDLVAAEPTGRVVVVVTSDRALADDVRRAGARVCGSPSLLALLGLGG